MKGLHHVKRSLVQLWTWICTDGMNGPRGLGLVTMLWLYIAGRRHTGHPIRTFDCMFFSGIQCEDVGPGLDSVAYGTDRL